MDGVDKVHSVASTDLDVLATVVNTATRELYEETQLRLRPGCWTRLRVALDATSH